MMQPVERGNVTLFLGAPTRVGQALNDLVREEVQALAAGGIKAVRNAIATQALRNAIGTDVDTRMLAEIFDSADKQDIFLSSMYGLGRPATAFKSGKLFPEAPRMLRGISAVLGSAVGHVVLAIEPLHWLFQSVQRPTLHERVRDARWEDLYDASWVNVTTVVRGAFPNVQLSILSPTAISAGPAPVLHHIFGSVGFELADDQAGERLTMRAVSDPSTVRRLSDKLGIDDVTCDLLEGRFQDDCAELARLDNVRVF